MRKVFIWGGCASRDAVEPYYQAYDLELHSYIARQSLISALHPVPARYFTFDHIKSKFQKRSLEGDITGLVPRHLERHADEIDLIVWDMMIERLGVFPISTGGYVTGNRPTSKAADNKSRLQPRIAFGSNEHKDLWGDNVEQFRDDLKKLGLLEKTVINATPWAVEDKNGQPTYFESAPFTAQEFNEIVTDYWDYLEFLGVKVARVSLEDAIADPDHKWGPAYFHYVPETHKAQLDAITSLI